MKPPMLGAFFMGAIMKIPETRFEFTLLFWFLCTFLGLASHGAECYLSGKTLSIRMTVAHFILAGGAGFLAVLVCSHYDWPADTSGIVCYFAGYGASSFIKLVSGRAMSKTGKQ